MNPVSQRGRAGAAVSGAAAFVFFALVWHASAHWGWPVALAGGALIGLAVSGLQWFMISRAAHRYRR